MKSNAKWVDVRDMLVEAVKCQKGKVYMFIMNELLLVGFLWFLMVPGCTLHCAVVNMNTQWDPDNSCDKILMQLHDVGGHGCGSTHSIVHVVSWLCTPFSKWMYKLTTWSHSHSTDSDTQMKKS